MNDKVILKKQGYINLLKELLYINKVLTLRLMNISMNSEEFTYGDVETFRSLHDELSNLEREVFPNEKER